MCIPVKTISYLYKFHSIINHEKTEPVIVKPGFYKTIDISSLPKGVYAIYIATSSNISDYSELNELLGKDLSKAKATINKKNYTFTVNKNKRYRMELIIG